MTKTGKIGWFYPIIGVRQKGEVSADVNCALRFWVTAKSIGYSAATFMFNVNLEC